MGLVSSASSRSSRLFDAVVFDLDGVLTDTAAVHFRAWKEVFDDFLAQGDAGGEFTHDDYLQYVDGKPRYEGVASFLESREIDLPRGTPEDAPGSETICGLGNRKNERFNALAAAEGVEVLPGARELLAALRERGIKAGVATASCNAATVLAAAGIKTQIDARVDGEVAVDRGLPGKPAPDTLVAASLDMGCPPDRAVLVEDAVAGVRAAVAGGFGLVVGVALDGDGEQLRRHGADLIVRDLSELDLEEVERWFWEGLDEALWSVEQHGFNAEDEGRWEALLTVGNGVFATRGAAEETEADEVHYPGTYRAGLYNRLESQVAGRSQVHEDLVNLPNWLPVRFRIGGGKWLGPGSAEIVRFHRRLDLKRGELVRDVVYRDGAGHETRVASRRFVSMDDPHLAALSYRIEPLNYEAPVNVRSGLDGSVTNSGVERYRALEGRHLEQVETGGEESDLWLRARTRESRIEIAVAVRHRLQGEPYILEADQVDQGERRHLELKAILGSGRSLTLNKVVALRTSLDTADGDLLEEAQRSVETAGSFKALAEAHHGAWAQLWEMADVRIDGDRRAQQMVRFNTYHLLASVGPHHAALDAGIPARGLHGEAYRGHIFWDEMFILPFYLLRFPETARATLLYRCRRLDRARELAQSEGRAGALFPWQSGSDGREETPTVHLNPLSGEWGPDHSRLQRHVSLAIAYNVCRYVGATGDLGFLREHGAELVVEVARFWADLCERGEDGRYSIAGVMGPNEFHETAVGAEEAGLTDNAYTNVLVAWLLAEAPKLLESLAGEGRALRERLALADAELEHWREIASRVRVPAREDGVLEQFDGFFSLEELDWKGYRSRHGDIARLDRILEAEGDSPDRYQAAKQADALMPFYVLGAAELDEVLERLGLPREPDRIERTFDYYYPRTSHGSTLSALVHGRLAQRLGRRKLAEELFEPTLRADFDDVQGGTTAEGIHTGTMAGSLLWVLEDLAGIDARGETLRIDPELPPTWRRLRCDLLHRGRRFRLDVDREAVRVTLKEGAESAEVEICGEVVTLERGRPRTCPL